nr:hypothetical protein [Brevifollis gellanilyticus]
MSVFKASRLLSCAKPSPCGLLDATAICNVLVLRCLAGEVEKAHAILAIQPFIQPSYLVIHQRIHRVEDDSAHTLSVFGCLCPKPLQHRQKKTFRFARTRASRHHKGWLAFWHIPALVRGLQAPQLMRVRCPAQWKLTHAIQLPS